MPSVLLSLTGACNGGGTSPGGSATDGGSPSPGPGTAHLELLTTCNAVLCLLSADGALEKPLPNVPAWDARWSSDGRTIAFVRPGETIWLADADGTNLRPVTTQPRRWIAPRWSPDGSRLAVYDIATQNSVATVRLDGTDFQKFTLETSTPLDWSPDGTRVMFIKAPSEVWTARADGTDAQRFTQMSWSGRWSPDGRQVAFAPLKVAGNSGTTSIVVADADGTNRRTVSTLAGQCPAWSPDGKRLAFTLLDTDGVNSQVVVIELASGVASQITSPTNKKSYSCVDWRRPNP